jgi:hypothetical protein
MLKRLPKSQAVLQVYAVIAVMLSGWTITAFLWKLSAWLLILNIGEIFTVFAYSMVINLIEGLLVLLLLLGLCMILPVPFFRDQFVVKGTILAAGLIGCLMAFVRFHMEFGMDSGLKLLIPPLVVLSLTGFLLSLSPTQRVSYFLYSAIRWISDRMIVFLYILIPLYVTVLTFVIFRSFV